MNRWIYDIETNGLLDQLDTIHCIGLRNVDTGETIGLGPTEIERGLKIISEADEAIAHNGICFDLPALQKVYPSFEIKGRHTDTLVLSRLIAANIMQDDAEGAFTNNTDFPKRLWGSHSLKAWGIRLGNFKGDYDGGWEHFSQEMLDYCVQDTSVTLTLFKKFMAAGFSQESIDLTHSLTEICDRIGKNGWTFDMKKASSLYAQLAQRKSVLEAELDDLFPPWTVDEIFIPKANNKTRGYVKGEPFTKTKIVQFNPSSRPHIQKCLVEKYGWKPKQFTDNGQAKIDDEVLGSLHYPEAKKLAEYFLIQKRIGQLAEGNAAWLKKVDDDGRLRHTIVPSATISGRAAHRSPNLGQVPACGAEYGKECRELFTVPDGWWLCGSDLSGLELRLLASYLNDPEYIKQILEGDIHTYNAKAFGVDRPTAKTAIYAMIYGAGNTLLGSVVGGSAQQGAKLKAAYDKAVPAFARLKKNLEQAAKRGYLKGLDGRHLYLRGSNRGLSQLLQGGGAVICMKWVELVDQAIREKHGPDAYIVGWIHDEVQIACRTQEIAHDVGNIAVRMAQETGKTFKTNIPIDAEYSVGRNWSETH